jgi:transcriptional regulator with XRE-family HTH domain
MRTPQELREVILELLDERKTNAHQMLKKCGYNASLVNDLKKGQMPSADKLANIAQYLGVSSDYLLGMEAKSTGKPESSDADLIEELRREFYGNADIKLSQEDKLNILDMAKTLIRLKNTAATPQKREKAE